ncbi:hypothetical protein PHYPO_G00072950 [Pangasianodon hypophthalmus]|uniref:TNFR-Cys domain-containing protein n=1 Tax=Pangasianodon hypophthalmus TaxID=310915 RepID=A0A5N5LV12_PANHP|nr:tumor necrosis factor receptor superfamily member 5 [Pangasianodon hypophthalmus]KAB5546512.1 hypothetical protein PHYPO_G00072950 [Pangasianodon hypophthalmus]
MAQTLRAKMHVRSVFILLVLSVVAESCDEETHYVKDNKCCKKCEPGTRMLQNTDCEDPVCQECPDGEYQDGYTFAFRCNLQPYCDPNLNLRAQTQSKTELSSCVCKPDHHCTSMNCGSCVRNTVCKAGEKVRKIGTRTTDTECERCPNGTFSDRESASTCKPWTECSSGSKEVVPGSHTSDRICEVQSQKLAIVIPVVVTGLLFVLGGLGYMLYRKGKTGSISFVQKTCRFLGIRNTHQPPQDNVDIETAQPANLPQEDTEDLLKLDGSLSPGISENGMPVIQDNSKSSLLSETETEPERFSVHL